MEEGKVKKPQVVIIGMSHDMTLLNQIVAANKEFPVDVLVVDRGTKVETPMEVVKKIGLPEMIHTDKKFFEKPKSKYHK